MKKHFRIIGVTVSLANIVMLERIRKYLSKSSGSAITPTSLEAFSTAADKRHFLFNWGFLLLSFGHLGDDSVLAGGGEVVVTIT